jgi:TP901 family phage tail tape measure protein
MAQQAEIGALRVRLAFDAGEFTRGIKSAHQELGKFEKAVASIGDRLTDASFNFNSGMRAAERFAGAVRAIFNASSEFGSGMSAVSTLVDTATESMSKMSEEVLAIGRRTPVALTDLTTGLYDLRSAGTSAEDAMERLERSAQLGVAGLGSTKEAVDLVTSSINAFGLKGAEADGVYNAIFKTIQAGKTTISGLAQGFGAVAGTVSTAGIKLEEYLASIAALTVTGVPAAVAHTQIRAAIAGLTRESELGTKVLDAMGAKTFKELVEKSGGMVAAFKNITAALGGNDANMIKLLGSVEAYNAVIALTGKQNDAFNATMRNMENGVDAVGEAFEKRNAGMGAAVQRMTNATQELGIALGNALAPTIKAVADIVTGLTEAFKSLSPEVQTAIASIGAIVVVGGPAAIAVGFFANALAALIPVLAAVGTIIAGLIAASGPIGLFVITASAVVTAWNMFQTEIMAIFNAVGDYITEKVNAIIEKLTQLKNFVSSIWDGFSEGGIEGAVKTVTDAMTDQFAQVEMEMQGVSVMMDTIKAKNEEAAKNAYVYSGPVISAHKAEADAIRGKNSAYSEALQLFNQTLTPMETFIFNQMKINSLYSQGAIDATTASRAMQKAALVTSNAYATAAGSIASDLGKVFEGNKAVAIAQALINTYQAVTNAWANVPWPLNIAAAATSLAAGMAQVANIKNTNKNSSGGGGGGSGVASGGTAAAEAQPVRGVNISLMGDSFSRQGVRDLIMSLNEEIRDGAVLTVA